jgi:hypothetical protein
MPLDQDGELDDPACWRRSFHRPTVHFRRHLHGRSSGRRTALNEEARHDRPHRFFRRREATGASALSLAMGDYRAGRNTPVEKSKDFFGTATEASHAGKSALRLFLSEIQD